MPCHHPTTLVFPFYLAYHLNIRRNETYADKAFVGHHPAIGNDIMKLYHLENDYRPKVSNTLARPTKSEQCTEDRSF